SGIGSVALGSYVSTNAKNGSMIFGDSSTTTATTASTTNQMTMRFAGGYRLFSNAGLTAGVTLAAGAGAWASVSDRRKKENFKSLIIEEILLKIKNMPVTEWNYKSQDITNHHIGPMAQDFYAAFKLSGFGNDTTITTSDIDGVNMIAIQALEVRTTQLKLAQNELITKTNDLEKLRAEVENFKKENAEFKNKLMKLENALIEIQQPKMSAAIGNNK
ncbi:MAG: tail fiber domain-containing protein, partial [Ferruginibacter sp.]|nr:tail fiber domain-containing protein [Ferruginibacter sp.]